MSVFNTSMFQSIKAALAKNERDGGNALYNEILRTTPGNTYTLRLLPNTTDPKNTFFEHYNHGWTSFATGQYVQALSPMTFGERDPIAEERYRVLRTGSTEEKEKMAAIRRAQKYLVNVYVIDDPTTPENNGKVKILRYGKQVHKIIMEAIEGEDSEEYGERIFDLSERGASFKLKCETQGEYPTYVSSRFAAAGKVKLSEEGQEKIYNGTFDLTKVFTLKSYDELKQMLDEHYYCRTEEVGAPVQTQQAVSVKVQEPKSEPVVEVSASISDDIDELLKDL
jgi:hypothetical protein